MDLGDATGLSVVHVDRTLQELRSSSLITLRDRTLTVVHDSAGAAGHCDVFSGLSPHQAPRLSGRARVRPRESGSGPPKPVGRGGRESIPGCGRRLTTRAVEASRSSTNAILRLEAS
jgi:hypothetical protein